jgi:hypothetical protein
MGWIFPHGASRKQVILELTKREDNEHATIETLRRCTRGNVLWEKKRIHSKQTGKEHIFVMCHLLQRSGDSWGYKSMDESAGPNYYHCPLSYLDGLDEPEGFAAGWRDSVRAYWDNKKKT